MGPCSFFKENQGISGTVRNGEKNKEWQGCGKWSESLEQNKTNHPSQGHRTLQTKGKANKTERDMEKQKPRHPPSCSPDRMSVDEGVNK